MRQVFSAELQLDHLEVNLDSETQKPASSESSTCHGCQSATGVFPLLTALLYLRPHSQLKKLSGTPSVPEWKTDAKHDCEALVVSCPDGDTGSWCPRINRISSLSTQALRKSNVRAQLL